MFKCATQKSLMAILLIREFDLAKKKKDKEKIIMILKESKVDEISIIKILGGISI